MTACQTPGMCKPHGGCRTAPGTETVDSTWLAQLRTEFAETARQRDLFAQAIADAAHKAGIIHADAQCDGPTLLMLLNDLVGCVERAEAERKQLCAIVELTPELEKDGETLISLVTQAKNAVTGATVAWEEQCARADELEDEAAMRRNIEYAAQHLPAGWLIRVSVEFEGSSVELINPDGEDVDFPSNHESLAQEVRDAVDALINPEPEDDPGQPPAPSNWKAIAPSITDAERQCHDPDCWCCDGTGRDPADSSPCKWNNKLPF